MDKCDYNGALNTINLLREEYKKNSPPGIVKDIVYMEYCDAYSVGESETTYLLFPKNMDTTYEAIIFRASCVASPVKQE